MIKSIFICLSKFNSANLFEFFREDRLIKLGLIEDSNNLLKINAENICLEFSTKERKTFSSSPHLIFLENFIATLALFISKILEALFSVTLLNGFLAVSGTFALTIKTFALFADFQYHF